MIISDSQHTDHPRHTYIHIYIHGKRMWVEKYRVPNPSISQQTSAILRAKYSRMDQVKFVKDSL